jgi:hypothetical protein
VAQGVGPEFRSQYQKKENVKPGVVAYSYNLCTQKAEGGSLELRSLRPAWVTQQDTVSKNKTKKRESWKTKTSKR